MPAAAAAAAAVAVAAAAAATACTSLAADWKNGRRKDLRQDKE